MADTVVEVAFVQQRRGFSRKADRGESWSLNCLIRRRQIQRLFFLPGGELFDNLVEFGYFPESKARSTMRQILNAVSYCHAERVAHRDLKVGSAIRISDWLVGFVIQK